MKALKRSLLPLFAATACAGAPAPVPVTPPPSPVEPREVSRVSNADDRTFITTRNRMSGIAVVQFHEGGPMGELAARASMKAPLIRIDIVDGIKTAQKEEAADEQGLLVPGNTLRVYKDGWFQFALDPAAPMQGELQKLDTLLAVTALREKNVTRVDDYNFNAEVLSAKGRVLVDFSANWCVPCQVLGPQVENLADSLPGVIKVVKLNVDRSPDTTEKYGVKGYPTVLLFENGKMLREVELAGAVRDGHLMPAITERVKQDILEGVTLSPPPSAAPSPK